MDLVASSMSLVESRNWRSCSARIRSRRRETRSRVKDCATVVIVVLYG
jgi:hypothetical protein